jgi:hypothetical protein
MDQIPDDLRLPDNPDDDLSEPDQVSEFEKWHKNTFDLRPKLIRKAKKIAKNPQAYAQLQRDVNEASRSAQNITCQHSDCNQSATHVVHTVDHSMADSNGLPGHHFDEPIHLLCPKHTIDAKVTRNLARSITDINNDYSIPVEGGTAANTRKRKAEDVWSQNQKIRERGFKTSLLGTKEDYADLPRSTLETVSTPMEEVASGTAPRSESVTNSIKDHMNNTIASNLVRSGAMKKIRLFQTVNNLKEYARNRRKDPAKRYVVNTPEERAAGTHKDDEGNSWEPPAYSKELVSGSTFKELVSGLDGISDEHLNKLTESMPQAGRKTVSDLFGYVRVRNIGFGQDNAQLLSLAENPDTYQQSFKQRNPNSGWTGRALSDPLQIVQRAPRFRLTRAAGINQLRSMDPKEVSATADDPERRLRKFGRKATSVTVGSGSNKAAIYDENDEGSSGDSGELYTRPSLTSEPRSHEVEGHADNDWDVRVYEGYPVLINRNGRVVHATFQPRINEKGEEDHTQGYWLATRQRVRHATEPRYLAPRDVVGGPKYDHSLCHKSFEETSSVMQEPLGHRDNLDANLLCEYAHPEESEASLPVQTLKGEAVLPKQDTHIPIDRGLGRASQRIEHSQRHSTSPPIDPDLPKNV